MTAADIIRGSYAAFHRGDVDAALAVFAPDIEWSHPDGMSDHGLGGTKKGLAEVRAFMLRARTVFRELRPEPYEFVEAGDRVLVLGAHHMCGARSGIRGTVPFVHSWRLAGGLATHFDDYHDTAQVRRIVEGDPTGPDRVIGLGLAFWTAKTVLSAVELGVFTELGGGAATGAELRQRLGLHGRGLPDFLDALVSLGLLDREDGRYRNGAAAAAHLDRARPDTYVGGLLELANDQWYASWGRLTEALRTGEPQENGPEDPFGALYSDPERVRRFQRAMTGGAMGSAAALADRLPWTGVRTVADIGCAEGTVLRHLLAAHPHLRGIGFDLPPVAPWFAAAAAGAGLSGRMTFVPGDFFTDPLPAADVLILGHVLHDWDLAGRRLLLRKAYDALPPGGLVVIYDAVIDDDRRRHTAGLLTSLHMLLQSPGGADYTGAECLGWLADAGFTDGRVEPLAGPDSMVLGHRP